MKFDVSERQQVVIIIVVAGMVLFSLAFFILAPLNMRRHQLERENLAKTEQLTREGYPLGEEPLIQQRAAENQRKREFLKYWQDATNRLDAFPDMASTTTGTIEHIDYKVELFDVENHLRDRARQLGIKIPGDLGLDDTLRSNEDARTRTLQLRAVKKLVDLLLDLKTGTIKSVEPLEPFLHSAGANKEVFMEEYPVLLHCQSGLANVLTLLRALKTIDHTLVVRRLRIQRMPGDSAEQLELNAVLSALVFVKDAQEILPVETRKAAAGRVMPLGH